MSETTEATSDISETVSEQTDRSLSETDRSLWSRFLMALNWLWMMLTSGVGFLVFLPVSLLAGTSDRLLRAVATGYCTLPLVTAHCHRLLHVVA